MSVEDDLEALLQQPDSLPVLFVGSGMSLRYLKTPTWATLLEKFAADAGHPMAYYRGKAGSDLPQVASLIAADFFERWFAEPEYEESRRVCQARVNEPSDPLKFEIARHLALFEPVKGSALRAEMEALKSVRIHSAITTNWDTFLERSLANFDVFVGQENVLFSQTQAVGEVYKIHGSITEPTSMVLTSEDYAEYWERNPYLIAKMLTLFVEHPVIFLGYSLTDPHIQRLLGNLISCLTPAQIAVLNDRLVFVRRARTGEADALNSAPMTINGHSINNRECVLSDFGLLYRVLGSLPQRFNASLLRKLKQDVYELAFTTPPTGKVYVVNLEDDADLDKVEVVIGVGTMARLGEKGYAAYNRSDLFLDMLRDSRHHDVKSLINVGLPTMFRGPKFAPVYFPLEIAGRLDAKGMPLDTKDLPAKARDLLTGSTQLKPYRAENATYQRMGFKKLLATDPDLAADYGVACRYTADDVDALRAFLLEKFEAGDNSTIIAKLGCRYDALVYGNAFGGDRAALRERLGVKPLASSRSNGHAAANSG